MKIDRAAMAETTMDAIKKKMQSMKLEKETAFDRADQLEQRLVEHKYIYDKVYTTATDSSLNPVYTYNLLSTGCTTGVPV